MSGHRAVPVEGEELQRINKIWKDASCCVRLHPDKWLYPSNYLRFADKIYNFKVTFVIKLIAWLRLILV